MGGRSTQIEVTLRGGWGQGIETSRLALYSLMNMVGQNKSRQPSPQVAAFSACGQKNRTGASTLVVRRSVSHRTGRYCHPAQVVIHAYGASWRTLVGSQPISLQTVIASARLRPYSRMTQLCNRDVMRGPLFLVSRRAGRNKNRSILMQLHGTSSGVPVLLRSEHRAYRRGEAVC